eukprot:scaffold6088_cov103-Skeletonema_menzelii.AAC.2
MFRSWSTCWRSSRAKKYSIACRARAYLLPTCALCPVPCALCPVPSSFSHSSHAPEQQARGMKGFHRKVESVERKNRLQLASSKGFGRGTQVHVKGHFFGVGGWDPSGGANPTTLACTDFLSLWWMRRTALTNHMLSYMIVPCEEDYAFHVSMNVKKTCLLQTYTDCYKDVYIRLLSSCATGDYYFEEPPLWIISAVQYLSSFLR